MSKKTPNLSDPKEHQVVLQRANTDDRPHETTWGLYCELEVDFHANTTRHRHVIQCEDPRIMIVYTHRLEVPAGHHVTSCKEMEAKLIRKATDFLARFPNATVYRCNKVFTSDDEAV